MHRNITYSEADYHLCYLNISLYNDTAMRLCGGRFGSYVEKNFGIKRLPYDIKLVDLILNGKNTDDLFVELPKDYFLDWSSYPTLSNRVKESSSDFVKNAVHHYIDIISHNDLSLLDFIHPYESSLNENFRQKYKADHPDSFPVYKHTNGHGFSTYESYMAYWRAYVLFEAVQNCKFIERYLNKDDGIKYFKESFNSINSLWFDRYSSTFNRLALYKSFVTRFQMSRDFIGCTYGEVSDFILGRCNSSIVDLQADMKVLLEIHSDWRGKLNTLGLADYKSALNLLKRDIYFMFEWLCSAGMSEQEIIDTWSYQNRRMQSWSQLKDVLDFEEIKFLDTFKRYVPYYSENIKDWMFHVNMTAIYNYLESLSSFGPWIRGFYDLHALINKRVDVKLVQPRIIDNLLVLSIRTEIVIREVYSSLFGEREPDDLQQVFLGFSKLIGDGKSACVFKTVSDKTNWRLTMLRERPEDIFEKVDSCSVGRNWSKEQRYFFKQILKFVTSRNYFAHHYYKDCELNNHVNELCRNVLVSCLHSVLYITSLSSQCATMSLR